MNTNKRDRSNSTESSSTISKRQKKLSRPGELDRQLFKMEAHTQDLVAQRILKTLDREAHPLEFGGELSVWVEEMEEARKGFHSD